MRKHRLLAVLVVVVLMTATLSGIAVQGDTIGKEAQACKNLGVLLGADASGVTSQYLAAIPTRLQAYIIALRLKGLYADAGSFAGSNNFKDSSEASWAKNYLSYAKYNPELGWTGYPDGRFGVNDKISGQAFYKVLLETLGYKQNVDFTYTQTLEFADKIGLIEDAAEIAAIKSFTINDIAKGIYGALNTYIAGTDKKLVDFLVDKGVFKSEIVEASGFNSFIQINTMRDIKLGIDWVPVKDTYTKMGCYIIENDKTNMAYEINKGSTRIRLTEGFTNAYINNNKVVLEKAVTKMEDGIFYVPVSFILTSAKEFGYDAEFTRAKNILRLQKSAEIKGEPGEMVLTKGDKKSIKVEKIYSEIEREVITSQCTYTPADNDGIVQVGSATGEVTGRNVGSTEVVISYQGKEVERVTVHVVDVVPKYYPTAYYEQVFDIAFRLDKPNYTDSYGVVWNKKLGVISSLDENDGMDTGSSLNILSYSAIESGVTADLTKLLEDRAIKGRTSILKIYAKGISNDAKLYAIVNIKTDGGNTRIENNVVLNQNWKGFELLKIDIPADAEEMTLEIAPGQNDEIRIDAFNMILN